MKTQFDHSIRVVSLENLKAMCEHVGGYWIEKVTTNRVHVGTHAPRGDEYGYDTDNGTRTAVFPAWPSTFDGKDNPSVALEIMRVIAENDDDYDAGGYFDALLECEPLHRTIKDGTEAWCTEYQIYAEKYGFKLESRWYQSCIQFWHVAWATGGETTANGTQMFPGDAELKYDQIPGEYRDYRDAQRAVVVHCRTMEGRV